MFLLLINTLIFYLIRDHISLGILFYFSLGALSFLFLFITFKKGWNKVTLVLTDCTIDRASSSLQQKGLPLTRTFVLKNRNWKMFHQSMEKRQHAISTYGKKKKNQHNIFTHRAQKSIAHEMRKPKMQSNNTGREWEFLWVWVFLSYKYYINISSTHTYFWQVTWVQFRGLHLMHYIPLKSQQRNWCFHRELNTT